MFAIPDYKKAADFKAILKTEICESLEYVADVCEDILDSELKDEIQSFIRSLKAYNYNSGYLGYLLQLIADAIEASDLPLIKQYFKNILQIPILNHNKIIIANVDTMPLYSLYAKLEREAGEDSMVKPIDTGLRDKFRVKIEKALCLIASIDPALHKEITEVVDEFIVMEAAEETARFHSFTDVKKLCSLFLSSATLERSVYFVAECIIHEAAHLLLFLQMRQDPMLLNDDANIYKSPLKKELRPMFWVYHAGFVTFRVVDFFVKLEAKLPEENEVKNMLRSNLDSFLDCYKVIKEHGKLTELGQATIDDCYARLQELQVLEEVMA